jgi:hypothetical protein
MAFTPPFTGSVTGDAGTVGTFYIICTQTATSAPFSFNWWKVSTPWGFAQGRNLRAVIDEVFDSGTGPRDFWLGSGKSVWSNPPATQTAPDTTHEVGSK